MILIQCVLALVVFSAPLWVGYAFRRKTVGGAYLYGQVSLWALFQIVAVPMIHLRLPFSALWISFSVIAAGLVVLGFCRRVNPGIRFQNPWYQYIPFILALLVILGQMGMYIFGMHLDEDDARWIAEANDALTKNMMYLHNPATGEYLGRFVGDLQKDVFSPWGMYIAVISRVTFIRPAVIAHTIYAPILLMLSYLVYDQIGKRLFKGTMERGIFLLMIAVVCLFMAGNVYTQAVFALTRIWQGKAVVAAVMIPLFLLLLLQIEDEDMHENWLWLATGGCACCLFSGMGIAISLIMIAVYGTYAVICKRFRRIPYLLVALLPSVLFGFFYFQMKG